MMLSWIHVVLRRSVATALATTLTIALMGELVLGQTPTSDEAESRPTKQQLIKTLREFWPLIEARRWESAAKLV
ncbi:MAG: hypothetical protein AAFU85_32470, partial [Planctomycetota bacterium]